MDPLDCTGRGGDLAEYASLRGPIPFRQRGPGDLSPEEECSDNVLFARAPGGDIWVSQYELPSATLDALRIRIKQEPDDLPF